MTLSFWRMSFELLRELLRWRDEVGAKWPSVGDGKLARINQHIGQPRQSASLTLPGQSAFLVDTRPCIALREIVLESPYDVVQLILSRLRLFLVLHGRDPLRLVYTFQFPALPKGFSVLIRQRLHLLFLFVHSLLEAEVLLV